MNRDTTDEEKYKQLAELTDNNFKAYLYDCDGTLADNMEAHKETYVKVTADKGVMISPHIIDEFAGLPIPAVVEEINKRYKSSFDPGEFERIKSDLFYNEYIQKTKPVSFVVDHLKANAGKHKIAVVSGSPRKTVEKTLEVLGIDKLVNVLVCAGETEKAKPYPDPFLHAAQQLEVEPDDCL